MRLCLCVQQRRNLSVACWPEKWEMAADGRDRSWRRLTEGWEYNKEKQLMWHESCGTVPCSSGLVPAYIQRRLIHPASTDDGWKRLVRDWWFHSEWQVFWEANFGYLKATDSLVPHYVKALVVSEESENKMKGEMKDT
jgi:hypothetical protein